jgi:hypothetical protein
MKSPILALLLAMLACESPPAPQPGIVMMSVPAGMANGWAFPCDTAPSSEWVEGFEIDRWPVLFSEIDPELVRTYDAGDHIDFAVTRYDLAKAHCASRGLDLPTVAELWRAARGERDYYEWGNAWHEAMVCPFWTQAGRICWWRSAFGVSFVLPADPHFGELVTSPHCPDQVPLDLTHRRVETDSRLWTTPPPLRGAFRCVRRAPQSSPVIEEASP